MRKVIYRLLYLNMCKLHDFHSKNFVVKGFKSSKNLFCKFSGNKKMPVSNFSTLEKSLTGALCTLYKNLSKNFVG